MSDAETTVPQSKSVPKKRRAAEPNREMMVLRIVVVAAILVVAIIVVASPGVTYTKVPRNVIFLLVACLPATLFAAEATARFEMKLPGFAATAGGAAAVVLITLVVLNQISKPDLHIAVFYLFNENNNPIAGLDRPGVLDIPTAPNGGSIAHFVDGNTLILIFPEQSPEARIGVRPVVAGPWYYGTLTYAGHRKTDVYLGKGKDLEPRGN